MAQSLPWGSQLAVKKNPHPLKFGSHRDCSSGYVMILVCHVILKTMHLYGHVTLWVQPLKVSQHPTFFVTIDIVVVEIYF